MHVSRINRTRSACVMRHASCVATCSSVQCSRFTSPFVAILLNSTPLNSSLGKRSDLEIEKFNFILNLNNDKSGTDADADVDGGCNTFGA